MIHPMNIFKKSAYRLRQGFSLIEVNIAIFVLATGALALLVLFPFGLQQSREATNEMVLSSCADRFLGAAAIAATHSDATDVESFIEILEDVVKDGEESTGFEVNNEDPSDNDIKNVRFKQFKNSDLYYYAWAYPEATEDDDDDTEEFIHVGILLSFEKATSFGATQRGGVGIDARKRANLFATKVYLSHAATTQTDND